MEKLLLTPLHEEHLKLKARMILFDGFDMPVQYTGIIEEHFAVRERVGIFDVSHMGEIELKGKDALPFAKVRDDFVLLVVNASSNYSVKDYDWIVKNKGDFDVEISNKSKDYGEVAVQGPDAVKLLEPLVKGEISLNELKRFKFIFAKLFGKKILISRTGYTGEDGFEIYSFRSEDIIDIWQGIIEEDKRFGIKPCGLGARDTTRFEVCYWLYGNDIDETVNPLESGQGWTVKFDKGHFIGKDALLKIKEKGTSRKLVGLYIPQGGIPRSKMEVRKDGKKIGYITSGNYCPSLKKVYAMAILDLPYAEKGSKVDIIIRNREVEAEVVGTPFLPPFNKR
jgi:aminomethyltransferase